MRLSGRPLLDNAADQGLFVGREEVLARIRLSLSSGLNCLVVGPPGSGKTSLVRAVMYRSHEAGDSLWFSYVRANAAQSAADLLTAVLAAVRKPGGSAASVPPQRSALDLLDDLAREIGDLRRAEPGVTPVLVVEDVLAGAGSEVFGALRDEVWELDVRWLVTTSTAQVSGWVRPPAEVFFETRLDLGPLTAEEAAELLRRRMEPDEAGEESAAELPAAATDAARETPRRLLELARELAAGPTVGGARLNALAGLEARAAAIGELSRPARMLAQELEALGWSSASDERLLARMGWTRPRVIQVMAELVDRGLVDMREESTGRGRPRKLYRLKPLTKFGVPKPDGPIDPGSS
jgi:energy-coupling factor transporter ATP-binding protein EcfA2